MNTGNTYYFIDDFNKICKCKNGMRSDESIVLETYELVDDANCLIEENEQLQVRNDRQAKQLDNLYKLIEKEDWATLQSIIQDFKDSDKQLQKEWKCYE